MPPGLCSFGFFFFRSNAFQEFGCFRCRINGAHADRVITGIDMHDFPCNAAAKITQQKHTGAANFFCCNVTAQGRIQLVPFQDITKITDAAGRQCFNRAGGDGFDTNSHRSHIISKVAYRSLQPALWPRGSGALPR